VEVGRREGVVGGGCRGGEEGVEVGRGEGVVGGRCREGEWRW